MRHLVQKWPLQDEAGNTMGGGGGGDTQAGGGGGDTMAGGAGDGQAVEARARRMGWVPQEEFRGDKTKWRDAQAFVKNGEESLPILRERLRSSEAARDELAKSVSDFQKMNDTSFQRGYEKAKRELEAAVKREAKAGNEEGAAAAATELAELEAEKTKREVATKDDPVFNAWLGQNAWYNDTELKAEAEAVAFLLRRKGDKTEGAPFLDKVKEEMQKRFPDKFKNPRREAAGGPERPGAGGDGGGIGKGKKGWEALPADAKQSGERYIKQKLYKDKASFAEFYFSQFD